MSASEHIQAICSSCQAIVRAKSKYAGRTVACPKCKSAMTVPLPSTEEPHLDDPEEQDELPEHSEEEFEDRRYRRRNDRSRGTSDALVFITLVAWGLLFLGMLGGGLLFMASLSGSQSAPQEAAAGTIFSTVFIGLYIVVRCIEKLVNGIERLRSH